MAIQGVTSGVGAFAQALEGKAESESDQANQGVATDASQEADDGSVQIKDLIHSLYGDTDQATGSSGQPSSGSGMASVVGGAAYSLLHGPDGSGSMPQPTNTRPPGDTRSADEIVAANPTLANLGNQDHVMDNLKKQCGDWTDPSLTPDQRADAAYRASEVINYIKSSTASDGSARSSSVTDDGKIDGFTHDGDARHGTEAGALKDFGEQGYGALSQNHALDKTSDTHVRKDGTTMSNAQWIGDNILKGGAAVLHVMSQFASIVGDMHIPGISEAAKLASVTEEAGSQGMTIGSTALEHGDVKGAAEHAALDIGEQGASQLIGIPGSGKLMGTGAKEIVKEVGKKTAKKGGEDAASVIFDGPSSDGTPQDGYTKAMRDISNL